MTTRLQITCIKMSDRLGGHDRIQRVGGATFNFEMHQAVVAAMMGEFEFFVHEHASGRDLQVRVNEEGGQPWLQAFDEGRWLYALLHLPQCVPPAVVGISYAIDVR